VQIISRLQPVTQTPLLYQHLEYNKLQLTSTLNIKNVPEIKHHINLSFSTSTLDSKRLASDYAISLDPLYIQESKQGRPNSHSGYGNRKSIT
jgi:hypothetical protein